MVLRKRRDVRWLDTGPLFTLKLYTRYEQHRQSAIYASHDKLYILHHFAIWSRPLCNSFAFRIAIFSSPPDILTVLSDPAS